ncbi:hypothetical protein B9T33_12285 [Acinetobacter sp. ANC 5054]|uniref:DUF2339 domain-containing protein n=1 Tax=Acinetobacter sp. ANC 5054 TaxID=1977877 RepID=UPI000A34F6B7|nr:DUF2339 domain-containing protein [Acinetobacter sp. ANC 5054]OTG79253.1 hypothetical protein B9T33_12285 [Acinetobacter sp. ANC 5054]
MLKQNNEIRLIWLMMLIMVGITAWYLDVRVLTYISGVAFIISVMSYVDDLQHVANGLTQPQVSSNLTSKIPLYIAALIIVVGVLAELNYLIGFGITAWVFVFLRWLKRLERQVLHVQQLYANQATINEAQLNAKVDQAGHFSEASTLHLIANNQKTSEAQTSNQSLSAQIQQWLFQGNPVLKVAVLVLVIGIVLLLRFATEHWQLSLALKLLIVSAVSAVVVFLGYWMQPKNRSFGLALEGLGFAALFLTLFFAYYNAVIASFAVASAVYLGIMLLTIWLSLKQQSVELAIMAMLIAYIAPFTLPVRDATATELVAYYLGINIAVAILSTLRPWKYLNQIAFLMTVLVGGSYAFYQGYSSERYVMSALVLAHAAIFIWLGFRFSQLLAQQDLAKFNLKPVLDIGLIFAAPLVAYFILYLMFFDDTAWQAGFSFLFAAVFAGLYQLSQRSHAVQLIAQSYFSLMLIFLALIPPILLPEKWSVVGWAVEGAAIFIFALYRHSAISRYLAMALLVMAGCSSLYYFVELNRFPSEIYWGVCLSYFAAILVTHAVPSFHRQLSTSTIAFQCVQMLSATCMLLMLILDWLTTSQQMVQTLFIVSLFYVLMNEILLWRKAAWSWSMIKWTGLIPVYVLGVYQIVDVSELGQLVWNSPSERFYFAITGVLLTVFWLRPLFGVREEKEWVSFGILSSLAWTSLTLLPSMPYISVVILPLLFCAWCYWQTTQETWKVFWQARSTLVLTLIWMVCSQLFSQQAFMGYLLPVLNPFDLVSLLMLAGFLWMLNQQLKSGLDRSMGALLSVLGLLWLSSYVVLRALHIYVDTPYNSLEIWRDATVQLSFTILWVSLALVSMRLASQRQLRPVWLLGGSILVIVTLKLVLLDLSHVGTLMRVISFMAAGSAMLLIAYIAPMPNDKIEP